MADAAARGAQRLASPWRCVLNRAGLRIHHWPSENRTENVQVLPAHAGVVVGHLFPQLELEGRTLQRLMRTRGQSLIDDHWGRYVAFLYDDAERVHYVVRDPSGQMPCYWLHQGRLNVFFSELTDVLPLMAAGPVIDENAVCAFLTAEDVRLRRTGFASIDEVFAGERVRFHATRVACEALWDPAGVCQRRTVEPAEAAVALLRRTTECCIEVWARHFDAVLLNLSGGFDSAVVLGCLMSLKSRPEVTAVNRYLPNPDEDERGFARAAAQRAAVELIECEWGASGVDLSRMADHVQLLPRPSVQSLALLDLEERADLAQRTGATATWTGQGGDHLFYQMRTALYVADHVRRCGWTSGVARAIDQAARLTRRSYASIVLSILRPGERGTGNSSEPFLKEPEPKLELHPWMKSAAGLPPGKRLQIAALVDLVHRPPACAAVEPAPEFHPLISQPLIEVCLQIPSDLLLHGGRLRGLAHEAFREHVPAEILQRESKGATRSYLVRIVRENTRWIRELLFDGLLMRDGLLDRHKLEPPLVKHQPLRPGQLFPLLACVMAELWLRRARQRAY